MAKGARGGKGGGSSGKIRIKNPANIPSNAITEDEFLSLRGVKSPIGFWSIDKLRSNRQLLTQRGRKRFEEEGERAQNAYANERNKAKAEYRELISRGIIRDKTMIEKIITKAHGHPDLDSTQAARRAAKKRGYNWRTGKKLKRKA